MVVVAVGPPGGRAAPVVAIAAFVPVIEDPVETLYDLALGGLGHRRGRRSLRDLGAPSEAWHVLMVRRGTGQEGSLGTGGSGSGAGMTGEPFHHAFVGVGDPESSR